jgi:nucleoside-diphosphate-sugar epimerase
MSIKKVLVTGASGFIGQPCLQALKRRGFEVHAVSSRLPVQKPANVAWHTVDLLNKDEVTELITRVEPAYLLHLAWYVEHGKYWSSPQNLTWVQATLDLADQFLKQGGQRLVCAGTCAEYDWKHKLLKEDETPLNPHTLYGACKAGLQTILNQWSKTMGVSFAWGRIFFPYGPHENANRLIPSTVLSLLRKEKATCNNPELERDFIYVDDLAEMFAEIVDGNYSGPINLASGTPVKLGKVVELIAEMLGASDLVEFGSNSKNGAEPPVLIADTSKHESAMKQLAKTSLEEGLQQTISWWQSQFDVIQAGTPELTRKSG